LIQKSLTAEERDYWWRLTHKLTSTKKMESKWRKQKNGLMVESTCPACGEEEEDREHYEYGCRAGKELRKAIASKIGRQGEISREEWSLEAEGMEEELMIKIVKARWIYHCDRCSIDNGKKKRMNIETIMKKLDRRINLLTEASKNS
jgi:hypothetical protein